MNIRVGQNSGAGMRFFSGMPGNTADRAENRLMTNGILGQQSGLGKDVAQFASDYYERQSQKKQTKSLSMRMREAEEQNPYRIVEESVSYARSLATARTSSKKTQTQVKKLQYNYKSISTQILRAKTSLSAKQVVLKAKRVVAQLKRQKGTSEYDEDEIDLAITHAQAMERVARKRARHLQEEELVKVTGGFCEGNIEDDLWEKEALEEQERYEENPEAVEQLSEESIEKMVREYEQLMEEYQRMQEESGGDLMDEFQDMMEKSMEKMLEESGLSELEDELFATGDREMDPADYKMMKLKHRMDEMKAIAKADAAYMKGIFDKYEQQKSSSIMPGTATGSVGGSMNFGGLASVSAGAAAADAFIGGSVDVSL